MMPKASDRYQCADAVYGTAMRYLALRRHGAPDWNDHFSRVFESVAREEFIRDVDQCIQSRGLSCCVPGGGPAPSWRRLR